MAFSPLRPLPPLHREPRESRSPDTLEALALLAVPYPGEATQENLSPCHSVQIKLEACEFEEARHESKKRTQKEISVGHERIQVELVLCFRTMWWLV